MIYSIGLIFVTLLIVISLDDFIWDIYILFRSIKGKNRTSLITYKELRDTVPGFLAVIVAAYNEENVLEEVIENLIDTNHYPSSMYHIFLGVYPNDPGTLKVADRLSNRHPNVHKVVHVLDGPSSKADNLNNVIKNILEFEREKGIRFKGIVVHDSEDLVHPYELLVENYLLNYHKAIQMPVFPLQEMPNIKNVFKNIISGTYADEFAENHYTLLKSRNATNSFVPSAGTGFALSREIIDSFPDNNIFPVGSLTEDYKLSLLLKQKGYNLHYVLEEVERLKGDGKVVREFISTRSIFPSTYSAAVRQKSRWIYGITMQSFKLKDIFRHNNLSFTSKYSLYKDWKAKFGNLLLGPGYLIFMYFLLSLVLDIPTMYPRFSLSWYLMIFLTLMMIERQFLRGRAVKNVYGFKSAFISVFFPPLLPFRMFVGNIINFHATARAWKMYLFKTNTKRKRKAPKWNKTDHEFVESRVLKTFRRNLGDILLHEKLISPKELQYALKKSSTNGLRLGEVLIKEGIVTEENVLISLCKVNKEIYLKTKPNMVSKKDLELWGNDFLVENIMIPILNTGNTIVFAISNPDDKERLISLLRDQKNVKEDIKFIYSTKESILNSIRNAKENSYTLKQIKLLESLTKSNTILLEEAITALKYLDLEIDIQQILDSMGFLRREVQQAS
jgi:adsorption protein B